MRNETKSINIFMFLIFILANLSKLSVAQTTCTLPSQHFPLILGGNQGMTSSLALAIDNNDKSIVFGGASISPDFIGVSSYSGWLARVD